MNEKFKDLETSVREMMEYLKGMGDSEAKELLEELDLEKMMIEETKDVKSQESLYADINRNLEGLRKRFTSYLKGKINDLEKELSELDGKLKGVEGKDAKKLYKELHKNYIAKLSEIKKNPTRDLKLIKDIGREFVSFRSRVESFLKQSPKNTEESQQAISHKKAIQQQYDAIIVRIGHYLHEIDQTYRDKNLARTDQKILNYAAVKKNFDQLKSTYKTGGPLNQFIALEEALKLIMKDISKPGLLKSHKTGIEKVSGRFGRSQLAASEILPLDVTIVTLPDKGQEHLTSILESVEEKLGVKPIEVAKGGEYKAKFGDVTITIKASGSGAIGSKVEISVQCPENYTAQKAAHDVVKKVTQELVSKKTIQQQTQLDIMAQLPKNMYDAGVLQELNTALNKIEKVNDALLKVHLQDLSGEKIAELKARVLKQVEDIKVFSTDKIPESRLGDRLRMDCEVMVIKLESFYLKIDIQAKRAEVSQPIAIKYMDELGRNLALAKKGSVQLNLDDHLGDLRKHVDTIINDPKYQEYVKAKFTEENMTPADRAVATASGQQLKTVPANIAYDAIRKLNKALTLFEHNPRPVRDTYRKQIGEQLSAMRKPEIKQALSDVFIPKVTQKPEAPPRSDPGKKN